MGDEQGQLILAMSAMSEREKILLFFFFLFVCFLLDKISNDNDVRSYRMHKEVKRELLYACLFR